MLQAQKSKLVHCSIGLLGAGWEDVPLPSAAPGKTGICQHSSQKRPQPAKRSGWAWVAFSARLAPSVALLPCYLTRCGIFYPEAITETWEQGCLSLQHGGPSTVGHAWLETLGIWGHGDHSKAPVARTGVDSLSCGWQTGCDLRLCP